MRVTAVHMPGGIPRLGLAPISMSRLGQVVILAGKNGMGKSRLLNCLSEWSSHIAPLGSLADIKMRADKFIRETATGFPTKKDWWHDEVIWRQVIGEYASSAEASVSAYRTNMFSLFFNSHDKPTFVHFVPKQITLADPNQCTSAELLNRARAVEQIGVGELSTNVLAHIQVIQNRWWNATHQNSMVSEEEKTEAITRHDALRDLIGQFLGTKLTRSINDQAELFGFPVGEARLSDGQKILLQFCVAVHAQANRLSQLIVLMDEPENHLHPDAMLDVIGKIQDELVDGQLWIATHSIPLLSHFDPDSIWWVEDGSVQHAGSCPEKVVESLVGSEDRIGRMSDLLGLPASFAANKFAFQCLLPPAVVVNGAEDPQNRQIQRILENCRSYGHGFRVVDFGAGRGRLISALHEYDSNCLDSTRCWLDYLAYDNSPDNANECMAAIDLFYERIEGNRRYFHDAEVLKNTVRGSVDVVILCNVLHEIDPVDWVGLLSEEGLICQLLRQDGFLLIVEDMEMRIGEKAYQNGFIVLDTDHIRTLFQIRKNHPGLIVDDARHDGRLKAHLVPACSVKQISVASIRKTLTLVKSDAKKQIRNLRKKKPDYRAGRKHAFFAQQLANAELALEMYAG